MPYKDPAVRKEYQHKRHLSRVYSEKHKESAKVNATKHSKVRYELIKNWYYENIDMLCCADCGLVFKSFLPGFAQFHHVEKKSQKISMGTIVLRSYNTVVSELNKGVFLCPNCHTIEHLHLKMENTCQS